MRARDTVVDSLRGIACVLLVTLHVSHTQLGEAQWLEWYGESFTYIRMPLFAFLSGVVYAWRPVGEPGRYRTFVSKKVRRVLVPYAIFVLLIGLVGLFADATLTSFTPIEWWLRSLVPYWFLLAMFWVYCAVALADAFHLLERRIVVAGAAAVLLVLNMTLTTLDTDGFLQLTSALYLGLFFLAGLAATRFGWRDAGARAGWIMAGVTVVLAAYTQVAVAGVWALDDNQRQDMLGLALGVTFPLALLALRFRNRVLAWIGGYSYGIFLLHPFTIIAAVAALQVAGVTSLAVSLVVITASGLFGSILGVMIMQRFAVGRVMLGEPARRREPAPATDHSAR